MKQITAMLLLLCTTFATGQIEIGTTYYSDKYGYKQVHKGAFKKELKKENDSVVSELFSKTKSGQIIWTKAYLGEQPYGIWKWFDKKGNVESERNYDFVLQYGELVPENAIRYKALGIAPMSDENSKIIQQHIRKKFRYPETAQANGIQGRVGIQFTIDKDGNVGNLRILEKGYKSLDTECFRIMNSLKKLNPYQKDGQNIMVHYTMPITFRLQ
ncbi:energy transducer TonB [Flagellimonas myxillae]|uniref:energy transducer TonB n=1 Tax=Flagellimonas myxillae TaxID=2942214 RepID=UPI00201F661B|nr:energy transducer TonB [Muricauda myxillae]MCL6265745.1 energy transducer TonB [Muricauda myxillae]